MLRIEIHLLNLLVTKLFIPYPNEQTINLSGNITGEITDYGSGGQSPVTSDPIEEDIPRLSSKTSLTPSDAHKVVIEVTDSDAENSKGT